MSDVSWADVLSAVSGVAGAITAGIALRIGRTANEAAHQSNRAADRANATADSVARLEHDRWHHEMTPQFDVTATELGPGTRQASLRLTFEGPAALERLDEVEIEIRDDGYTHSVGLAGGPSEEEVAAVIWGPYRFKPRVDDASPDGRKIPAAPMDLGDWRKLALEESIAPPWTGSGTYWRDRYGGTPIRLWVRCRREGHQPWVLTYEVPVVDPSAYDVPVAGSSEGA